MRHIAATRLASSLHIHERRNPNFSEIASGPGMKYCKSSRFLFFPLTCLWVKGDSKVLHKVFFPSFFSLRNCSMFTQLSTHIHSHTKRIKKSNISVQCLAKFSPVRKVPTSYRVDGQSCCFWVHASMESNYFFFNSVHKTLLNNEKRAWFNGSMHQKTSIIY